MRAAISVALVAGLIGFPVGARDIYVDAAVGDDTNDGDVTRPVRTVSAAIDLAAATGDRILVRPGTYTDCPDTGFTKTVAIVSTEFATSGTNASTFLDGGGAGGCGAAAPVVTLDQGSSLRGFTVRNGRNSGVWLFAGAVITNNVIAGNSGDVGGGVFAYGTATITNNVVTQNVASYGGGLYLYSTDFYGDTDDMLVADNALTDNEATLDGGGGYVYSVATGAAAPSVVLADNDIRRNTADGFGGGIAILTNSVAGASASVRVTTNTISNNEVVGFDVGYGGGVWAATAGYGAETIRIDGNTVQSNTTTLSGGGISAWVRGPVTAGSSPDHEIRVDGNDVLSNTSSGDGGGIDLYVEALTLLSGVGSMRLSTEQNRVSGNRAEGDFGVGGGLIALVVSERTGRNGEIDVSFQRDEITGNRAFRGGGGLALLARAEADPAPADPLDPRAPEPAGATIRVSNALVANNTAACPTGGCDDGSGGNAGAVASGGGILAYADSNGDALARVEIDLVTVADNASDIGGAVEIESIATFDTTGTKAPPVVEVENSIVAGNDAYGIGGPAVGAAGTITPAQSADLIATVNFSDLFGNASGAIESTLVPDATTGTIFSDPLLDANFVPGRCSPTIDAGDPTDDRYLEEPAFHGDRLNMGDLGGTSDAVRSLSDINGDGIVDGLDVVQITTRNASTPGPGSVYLLAADLDRDGMVDGDDLSLVGADFALECP